VLDKLSFQLSVFFFAMTPFLNPAYIISILIAISVHEWAHAITAHRFGDPTAQREGRLTLNPIAHLDPLGALMFLVVGFGWARPVPVNPAFFRNPKSQMAIVALAGPFSNLILALIAFIGLALLTNTQSLSLFDLLSPSNGLSSGMAVFAQILGSSLFVNLGLMAFNLIPVAPLDGSNILRMFIPYRLEDRYDDFVRIGPFILLGLLLFESFLPIQPLSGWVHFVMGGVLSLLELLMGAAV
jgi:Zn-dependent protease